MIANASSGWAFTTSPIFLTEDSRTCPSLRLMSILGAIDGNTTWVPSAAIATVPDGAAAAGAGRAPATGGGPASWAGAGAEPMAGAVIVMLIGEHMRAISGRATNRPINSAVTHRIAASMILNQ